MDIQTASSGYSGVQLVVWAIVILLASNTTTALVTSYFKRKTQPGEMRETDARADLARAQSHQSIAETLKLVAAELRETHETLVSVEQKYLDQSGLLEILEVQVARARARGFLDREEHGGTGPNPAA